MIPSTLPKHIAVIMDGNGRWAKQRHLPRTMGHKAGTKAVRNLIENAVRLQISVLTLFAFSSENWQRPDDEVQTLMDLFFTHLEKEVPLFKKHNIQVRIIGDLQSFSEKLRECILRTQNLTADHTGLVLVIAASYSGRWDITQAAQQLAQDIEAGRLTSAQLDSTQFSEKLCLADLPEPDLLIRTSGERRLSNFLLWQLAYTELYFTDVYWPDFDTNELDTALAFFSARQRRFGQV
jgi:undecaprenyl diphosphate synthase